MDIREYDLLEQQDFLEVERKELYMRFIEQTNSIFATAKDAEQASKLVERLKLEYFVDYLSQKKETQSRQVSELIEMQKKTYSVTATGSGLFMEIRDAHRK